MKCQLGLFWGEGGKKELFRLGGRKQAEGSGAKQKRRVWGRGVERRPYTRLWGNMVPEAL